MRRPWQSGAMLLALHLAGAGRSAKQPLVTAANGPPCGRLSSGAGRFGVQVRN